jgi:DNA polymerase epsilon subunit 1
MLSLHRSNVQLVTLMVCRIVLDDSLQLAQKCILNSFLCDAYWSETVFEGDGQHCNTHCGLIIRRAKEFIDCIGLPIELDMDGIWSMLPMSFLDTFSFQTRSGKAHNRG